jgi:hypothetical protein
MNMTFAKEWVSHRAKAFAGFFASSLTMALLIALEKTFDIQLGTETKATIVGFVTSQVVYWVSNGPKEGTA